MLVSQHQFLEYPFKNKISSELLQKKELILFSFTIANPTSALLSAGPSLVPSPVTATTSRCCELRLSTIPLTKLYLSVGDERAKTRSFGQTSSSFCCEI